MSESFRSENARSFAERLATTGEADESVGFAESVQHEQFRCIDGEPVSRTSRVVGGFSRTVRRGEKWAHGSVPWTGSPPGKDEAVDAAREELCRPDASVPSRVERLLSTVAQRGDHLVEVVGDVFTRRKSVAQRGGASVAEESRWVRLRVRIVDEGDGKELARRQWVGRGSGIDEGAVAQTFAHQPPMAHQRATDQHRTTAVALEGSASACLLHELFGHVAEQDSLGLDTPYAAAVRRLDDVHPDLVVLDDPTLDDGIGTHVYDDEGTLASPTPMLADGQLASGLGTIIHRADDGTAGCARRMSFADRALPRASNTVVLPGNASVEEVFGGTGSLLVITGFSSGYVVPATGDFQYVATRSRLLGGDGTFTDVGDVLVTGNAVDTLRRITAVGSDTATTAVTCGKKEQWITVGMSSPSIRLERLEWSCA